MSYSEIVKNYLMRFQSENEAAIRGGQHTAEMSFRPVLDSFIRDLSRNLAPAESIDVVLEPRNQRKLGRPDWRLHNRISLGIYGYIEAKEFSPDRFNIVPYQNQINRYLSLGHKLIITDGIEFLFCMSQEFGPYSVSLVEKAILSSSSDWSKLTINPEFKHYMEQFLNTPAPQWCDEVSLIEQVALRTRLLSDDLQYYAGLQQDEAIDEEERQTIELLSDLRNLLYAHNDSSLRTERVFANFVAQVIMFCLLYAHRVHCDTLDSPTEKYEKIVSYAYDDTLDGDSLVPFRKLMLFLRDNATENIYIMQWIKECIQFLSFVQMNQHQLLNPDYHRLFERFLAEFDPQSRFDYGAYYTPEALASYVVKLTESIANLSFDNGSIFKSGNTIIDPCCGTGSFLEQIVLNDPGTAEYRICGIEILPAPYMLANYRTALLNKQNYHHPKKYRKQIILANTLCNGVFEGSDTDCSIEGEEVNRVRKLSSTPLRLIIGNPPSSDSNRQRQSQNLSILNCLLEDFRPPVEERRARQNIQMQVNNSHMQFLRWSCKKLLDNDINSILSFIMPSSFLEAESYKYARKYLIEHFHSVWIVKIDADARTGIRNNSLFHTLQGRAVIILTKSADNQSQIEKYRFLNLSGLSMEEKSAYLKSTESVILDQFIEYPLNTDTYKLLPSKPFDIEQYNRFWHISGDSDNKSIFLQHCSGIKLAPTSLFTHVKSSILKRRSKDVATKEVHESREWFAGQDRQPSAEKISAFKRALNACGSMQAIDEKLAQCISAYSFRPYLTSNVLLWRELLNSYSSLGGGGTRQRPELQAAFSSNLTIGFAMAHAPKDLNPTLSQFVSFCWYYPDNDMCTRGNSHIYMNQYPESSGLRFTNNISNPLLEKLRKLIHLPDDKIARCVVFYTYAVLCSQEYLDRFEGALFTVNQSNNRARVPIVDDAQIFTQLCTLGEELARLEKRDYSPDNLLCFDYDSIISKIPTGFKLTKTGNIYDEDNEVLILKDRDTESAIHIPCPVEIMKLNISGYDIVKNVWLKFYSYNYTHCDFSGDDLTSLLNLLNTLAKHIKVVADIDDIVRPIMRNEIKLIQPDYE